MLAILFQEKTKKMLVFPKNAEKNASTIEKGLPVRPLNMAVFIPGFNTPLYKMGPCTSGIIHTDAETL